MVVGARGRWSADRLFDLGNYLFLIVFSLLMIYPFRLRVLAMSPLTLMW